MSFLDIAMSALAVDIGFFIDIIMNNLFWVFGFIAGGYFFTDRKHFLLFGLVFAGVILMTVDFFNIVGFSIYTATGLFFLYLGRMSVLLFLENTEKGARLIPLGYILVFFFTFAMAALGVFG